MSLFDMVPTRQEQILENFEKFHGDNPQVYRLFKRFALLAIQSGRSRYSSDMISHRIRWHVEIETTGEPVKMNDHYTAYYARLFEADHPEHQGFFRKRKLKSAEREGYEVNLTVVHGESPDDAVERQLGERLRRLLDNGGGAQ